MEYKDDFRIMQITDIHFGIEMDLVKEFEHLTKMIEQANNPDLIVITGDSFLDANKAIVRRFVEFFDGFDIPWTFTFGNHDLQGDYGYYFINREISKAKNVVFVDYKDDNLTGFTNFYINLKKDGNTLYRLFIIDSNCYYNKGLKYEYDVIAEDQLEHLKAINAYENDSVKSLAFFHIPLHEFEDAYAGLEDGTYSGFGENNENICYGYENNGSYDVFKSIGTIAIFTGHDHVNCSTVYYKNEMYLSYGVKATDLVYNVEDMIGYKEIILPSDPSAFDMTCIKNVWCLYE